MAKFWSWIAIAAAVIVAIAVLWKFTGWLDQRLARRDVSHAVQAADLPAVAQRADGSTRKNWPAMSPASTATTRRTLFNRTIKEAGKEDFYCSQ